MGLDHAPIPTLDPAILPLPCWRSRLYGPPARSLFVQTDFTLIHRPSL